MTRRRSNVPSNFSAARSTPGDDEQIALSVWMTKPPRADWPCLWVGLRRPDRTPRPAVCLREQYAPELVIDPVEEAVVALLSGAARRRATR